MFGVLALSVFGYFFYYKYQQKVLQENCEVAKGHYAAHMETALLELSKETKGVQADTTSEKSKSEETSQSTVEPVPTIEDFEALDATASELEVFANIESATSNLQAFLDEIVQTNPILIENLIPSQFLIRPDQAL